MRSGVLSKSMLIERTPSILARSMFYYIQSAGHYFCTPEFETTRENYDSILVLYTIAGAGTLKYRSHTFTISPGQAFIIDCMEPQYYATNNSGIWDIIYIHFNGSESRNYTQNILANNGPVFKLDRESSIPHNILTIHNMLQKDEPSADIIISKLIVEILTELMLISTNGNIYEKIIPKAVLELIQIIHTSYNREILLEDLCKKVGFSKYYLSRLFKKHTGYSPYEYLIKYRLSQAKNLLKTTDMTVCEIASKSGFTNTSYFCRLFRQIEKISPLQFRKHWR